VKSLKKKKKKKEKKKEQRSDVSLSGPKGR